MTHREVELLAIGGGPANLALAVALEESAPDLARESLIIEKCDGVAWQRGLLLPWVQSQVSFLKDLVTLRNPCSRFSFVNYLHSVGRLDDFINLGSFTPYRAEISAYLGWVAGSLDQVRIEYGRACAEVEPTWSADGAIDGWLVRLRDGSTIGCRTLVVGAGRDAYVPEVFGGLPASRVIHSTEFVPRIAKFDADAAVRVAVIGGAQSAAEMLWATYQRFPRAQCTMVMRSIGLAAYESSRFVNELYYPSFVDKFHAAHPDARHQLLTEMHRTNYAGVAPDTLESLYRQVYLDRCAGTERIRMITLSDVTGARHHGDGVVLSLRDRRSGATDDLECDLVLLGTGFVREMPAMISDLAKNIGLDEIAVGRRYRLEAPTAPAVGCYLQGVNEVSHGIADSLLSVLAVRAQEIVSDIVERRGHPYARTGSQGAVNGD